MSNFVIKTYQNKQGNVKRRRFGRQLYPFALHPQFVLKQIPEFMDCFILRLQGDGSFAVGQRLGKIAYVVICLTASEQAKKLIGVYGQ